MKARIYKPGKTAMQSGTAKTREWLLEFDRTSPEFIEPLMGWNGQTETIGQLDLWFDSEEEAVQYASRHGIEYEVIPPKARKVKPKSYADNFRYDRVESTKSGET